VFESVVEKKNVGKKVEKASSVSVNSKDKGKSGNTSDNESTKSSNTTPVSEKAGNSGTKVEPLVVPSVGGSNSVLREVFYLDLNSRPKTTLAWVPQNN
jgi:hypothetical protein